MTMTMTNMKLFLKQKPVKQAEAFLDWFCPIDELSTRAAKLAEIVRKLAKSPKIDSDKMSVRLKNNCPCEGSLYDTVSIFGEDEKVVYTISPALGHDTRQPELWGLENNFEAPLVVGDLDCVYKFLGTAH